MIVWKGKWNNLWFLPLTLSHRANGFAAVVRPGNGRVAALTVRSSHSSTDASHNPWVSLNPSTLSGGARYGLFISAVVPRPVAVITTTSRDGIINCAPFSYTSLSAHDPPIVTHGLCMTGGQKKHTLLNIEDTGEWVYNILTTNYLEEANNCAATVPFETDETQKFGLDTIPCDDVAAPRLAQAAVSMECKLYDMKEIFNDQGQHTTTIVMGRVVKVHIHRDVMKEGQDMDSAPLVDLLKLQAVGRAGDVTYWPNGALQNNTLPLTRPK